MLFDKQSQLNILTCSSCKGVGLINGRSCSKCRGKSFGLLRRQKWLFWSYPLTRYNIALLNYRRIWYKIRKISLVIIWLNAWFWSVFLIYNSGKWEYFLNPDYSLAELFSLLTKEQLFLFWIGIIVFFFLIYRIISERKNYVLVEKFDYNSEASNDNETAEDKIINSWSDVRKIPNSKRFAIDKTFTNEAMSALSEAYYYADKNNYQIVSPEHLFYSLLSFNRISNIFIRLGVPTSNLRKNIKQLLELSEKTKNKNSIPLISDNFAQILFSAYEEGYEAHQEYVSVTELLISCIKQSVMLQEILYDLNIEKDKLVNVVEWARIKEKLHRRYIKRASAASHRSKHGMDKAMTALATPYLNSFSEDMTLLSQLGHFEYCVARDNEMQEMFRIIDGGSTNLILSGSYGVGKRTLIEGLAGRMITDDVPKRLRDKRLVRLSVPALLSGTTASGAIERLIGIMKEVSRARNVILFIHNIHELVGISAGDKGALDVADSLAEYLKNGRFLTIATTTDEEYSKYISDSPLSNIFTKINIKEMDENQAIQVVESKVGALEYKHKVFFSYNALEKAVKFALQYMHESYLPGSAMEIVREAAAHTHTKKGNNTFVTVEEVAKVVVDKTGIPLTTITANESEKLINLELEMHKNVIGQEEAVNLVSNALRRARVEMRSKDRPISNFLFLGPTGVGKTELAKTISKVYFGGEDRMIRIDMSEYQDKSSIYRLIGAPGEKGTGILTEAVRRNPFTLLLLDEIEKADPGILNLFLQVMDDGRLTDSTGKIIDFTNVIIIATSNAGTSYVQEQMRIGLSNEVIKDRLLHGELKQYFKPEFLNRFDGIVLFKSLTVENIKEIAALMLKRVVSDLEKKGIILKVEDSALEYLAGIGFDPEFGARPMRRVIQDRVENQLAEMLLTGVLKRQNEAVLGLEGKITVIK